MRKIHIAFLILLLLIAFSFRVYKLDAVGLSFDETHKIQAAHGYLHGDFYQNLEHPMLMKTFISLCFFAAEKWNKALSSPQSNLHISDEAVTRFPNIFIGTLMTLVLFFFARAMFNNATGWITALLWATSINAIAFNRIAKEDSMLVFFAFLGYYFYWKAKFLGPVESKYRERLYIFSGASFGLMMASKYFPHYFGLNFLFHITRKHEPQTNYYVSKEIITKILIAFFIAFVVANPSLFLPVNVHYLFSYIAGDTVTHHGYEMMNHLFNNNFMQYENSTPFYYYLLFIAVKMPPALILALAIGLIIIFKTHTHPGYYFLKFMFLFWFIPFSFLSVHWLRYALNMMPMIYMICAVGIYAVYIKIGEIKIFGKASYPAATIILICFLMMPFIAAITNSPYYLFYVNDIGGGKSHRAYYFPHDEVYDAGVREAVAAIVAEAPQKSIIFSDTTDTVAYYLEKYQRADLDSYELSAYNFRDSLPDSSFIYLIDQKGRTFFETQAFLEHTRSTMKPVHIIQVDGITTTRIYRFRFSDFHIIGAVQ